MLLRNGKLAILLKHLAYRMLRKKTMKFQHFVLSISFLAGSLLSGVYHEGKKCFLLADAFES